MIYFERWSLLIIGEALLHDVTRISDFERNLLIDRATLKERLASLVNAGLMDHMVAQVEPPDAEYVLTDKGRDLEVVVRELDLWSERWSLPIPPAAELSIDPSPAQGGVFSPSADAATVPIELSVLGAFSLRVRGEQLTELFQSMRLGSAPSSLSGARTPQTAAWGSPYFRRTPKAQHG